MAPSVLLGPRHPSPGLGLLTKHSVPGQGRPRPLRNLHNTRGPRRGTWLVGKSNIGLAFPAWSFTLTVSPTMSGRAWSSRSSISVLLVTSLSLGIPRKPYGTNPRFSAKRSSSRATLPMLSRLGLCLPPNLRRTMRPNRSVPGTIPQKTNPKPSTRRCSTAHLNPVEKCCSKWETDGLTCRMIL